MMVLPICSETLPGRSGKNRNDVAILLATYNGEKHLDEQITSLFSQTYQDIIIFARDDRSLDKTPDILEGWANEYPDKFLVVHDELGKLGLSGNFSRLMEICDLSYFAFCDQDDVWLPNHVELMLEEIRLLEREFSIEAPIFVHSDLKIVDEQLSEISPSLFDYRGVNLGVDRRLERLIFDNIVVGCASMGNRSLLELGRPVPTEFSFHDWWLALLAASCGVLRTIPKATILYRQHSANQVGAGQKRKSALWDSRHVLQQPHLLRRRLRKAMAIAQSQAHVLLRVGGDRVLLANRESLRAFCLPCIHEEVARLRRFDRMLLTFRYLWSYARALPLALRWC